MLNEEFCDTDTGLSDGSEWIVLGLCKMRSRPQPQQKWFSERRTATFPASRRRLRLGKVVGFDSTTAVRQVERTTYLQVPADPIGQTFLLDVLLLFVRSFLASYIS